VKVKRRSSSTRHRGRYLLADNPRLSDTQDHYLSFALREQLNHTLDLLLVKSRRRLCYCLRFDAQYFLNFSKVALAHVGFDIRRTSHLASRRLVSYSPAIRSD
jgi:hypothetical protein